MTHRTPVFCETAELAAEAASTAEALGLVVAPEVSIHPVESAALAARKDAPSVALCLTLPEPAALISALDTCSDPEALVLSVLDPRYEHVRALCGDLGVACVSEVAPAFAVLSMLLADARRPWKASPRKLSALDKLRLEGLLGASERSAGKLVGVGAKGLALQLSESQPPVSLGHARDVAEALHVLSHRRTPTHPAAPRLPLPGDLSASRDVLFGPPRLLSDPSSKAALLPFGLPMPQEELCASPSRASSEAARIGFPVRISLASPDLRVWDHPDLSVDGVDNAARVRDVYRQLTAAALERAPEARVLGVTVTATTLARALIRVTARPMPGQRALLRVSFADPHGANVRDATTTLLPSTRDGIAAAMGRLAGHTLLLGHAASERERNVELLCDLFGRIGSFIEAFGREVARVELHPVALLVGGGAEVREAAIQVTDAFVRDLG